MTIENFTKKLQNRLSGILPGEEAHKELAPEGRYAFKSEEKDEQVKSAVLILLFQKDDKILIPFIQKTIYPGIHSGQVSLPGGKAEKYDKDIIQTALRETEEEIGIQRETIKVIGKLSPLYIPVSNFEVNTIIGYIDYLPKFILNESEVAKLFFIDIQEFKTVKTITRQVNVRNKTFNAPFFIFNETEIWGATAMILNELKFVLK